MRSALLAVSIGVLALSGLTACGDDGDDTAANTSASFPAEPATGAPIKIGFVSSEGGAIGTALTSVRQSAEAATRYLNDNAGGIKGHKIELVVCKQEETPATATACATTGAFSLTGGTVAILNGMAQTAAGDGIKKIAVIAGTGPDSASLLKQIGGRFFTKAGVEAEFIGIPLDTPDPTPQITAALKGKPGAVGVLGDGRLCTALLKTLPAASADTTPYVLGPCLDKTVLEAVGGDAVKGAKLFGSNTAYSDEPESALYRQILGAYAPDVDPAGIGYGGYQAVMGFAEALNKSAVTDFTPAGVKQAMTATKDVPLPSAGGLTFTCDGKAFPLLSALCSLKTVVSDVDADGRWSGDRVVGA
ncbi:branched-chain amino acid transport system substrate-binding protein [Gordonia amarae]|uniref:ABC transporter substrate-binding protein n=1 Tax=Gordonia amarae TaxID=36821 RepID=UPI00031512C2|nr:ABC transporter substrate-binding protein [Gordonia amarae]MCS3877640.1 branched-chain amino acid transport system substrate-binding protein [Gordonia amarae]